MSKINNISSVDIDVSDDAGVVLQEKLREVDMFSRFGDMG
jgi:hypothetical protein